MSVSGNKSVRCWSTFVALRPVRQGGRRSISIAPPWGGMRDRPPPAKGAIWDYAEQEAIRPAWRMVDPGPAHPHRQYVPGMAPCVLDSCIGALRPVNDRPAWVSGFRDVLPWRTQLQSAALAMEEWRHDWPPGKVEGLRASPNNDRPQGRILPRCW